MRSRITTCTPPATPSPQALLPVASLKPALPSLHTPLQHPPKLLDLVQTPATEAAPNMALAKVPVKAQATAQATARVTAQEVLEAVPAVASEAV
jgi:hypothetical protein